MRRFLSIVAAFGVLLSITVVTSNAAIAATEAPTPTVTVSATVGTTLFADPGDTWDNNEHTYQWYRNDLAIANAANISYKLTPSDYLARIYVEVSGTYLGAPLKIKTASVTVAAGSLSQKPAPKISGSATVGSVLTAVPGVWDSGVSLAYQWFRDGVAVSGATSASYSLGASDYLKSISVKVTGSAAGYASETTASDSFVVAAGTLATSRPIISGATSVGSVLTAVTGVWTTGTKFTFQWFSDGAPLVGETSSSHTYTLANSGHELSVVVSGSLQGYASASVSSAALFPARIAYTPCSADIDTSDWLSDSAAQPTIPSEAHVGSKLAANLGSWSLGTTFCMFWYQNGQAVKGVYGKSYTVQPSDLGQNIQLVVIGTDKSGNSRMRYSQFVTVTKSDFKTAPEWAVIGLAKVGYKLAVTVTKYANVGVTYTFQWLRNGVEIVSARSNSYVATADDLGAQLSVRVCSTKLYYNDLCTTSTSSSEVLPGRLPKK